MPLFEYSCRKCSHVTAFLEKADARGPHACEKCGSKDTEKMFSTFAARAGESAGGGESPCDSGACPMAGQCPHSCGED